jgi:Histidine kinase
MSSLTVVPARSGSVSVRSAELSRQPSSGRAFLSGPLFIGTAALLLSLATAVECRSITHLPSLIYGLILWGWWGILASVLWQVGPGSSLLRLSRWNMALHLLIACAAGVVHLMLLGSLSLFIAEWRVHAPVMKVLTGPLSLNRFGLEILIYGFILGIIGSIQSQIRGQRDALSSLELQRQLAAAQLKALQMQLEPHFLFNTLNAITTLVELGRQQQAAEMLNHLNVILKRTLERSTPEKIPLSQELEIVENYLAIEQVRFADRLRIDIKIDPAALHSLVPCFLLQPIVENAIRHGIANCEGEGTVEASARGEGNRLRIQVRDSGPGKPGPTTGNGIGLKNTRDRLAYFYPQGHTLEAGPSNGGGFEVAIDVPYESAG